MSPVLFDFIPMGIPSRFARGVLDGTLARHGCLLKDAASGRIVGHLKELAGLERALSLFPLNPLLSGASPVRRTPPR